MQPDNPSGIGITKIGCFEIDSCLTSINDILQIVCAQEKRWIWILFWPSLRIAWPDPRGVVKSLSHPRSSGKSGKSGPKVMVRIIDVRV